jgi:hypothetical protein
MTIKNHMLSVALATAMATTASIAGAQAADAVDNQNAVTDPAKPNSGPGVQGPPDTRTGPATRAPGDADANEPVGEGDTETDPATTQPSQDSSGVEGMPGNKSGPAVKTPGGAD